MFGAGAEEVAGNLCPWISTTHTRSKAAGRRSGRPRRPGRCRTQATRDSTSPKPKNYVLEMLPYPSGEPHIGHLKVYSVGDAIAHFRRRHGLQVVHPMGYDAFGLPAENNAIKTGEHPPLAVGASIAEFRRQFHTWGVSLDWSREVATCDPAYYRWTQWLFLRFFEAASPTARRRPSSGARRPDRARQRAGDRRPLRALRRRGRLAQARAVVLQDHRLRRRACSPTSTCWRSGPSTW